MGLQPGQVRLIGRHPRQRWPGLAGQAIITDVSEPFGADDRTSRDPDDEVTRESPQPRVKTTELPVGDSGDSGRPAGGARPGTTGTKRGGPRKESAREGRRPGQLPPDRRAQARRHAQAAAGGVRAVSATSARMGRGVRARIRKATTAQGMGESGLSKLIELHAFNAGGDAAMAIGLAGTLFFQVPSGEARGKVALYLLLTMAPFVLIAPLLGPMLDRLRRGRRWAIGTTMASRAFFCWVLAGAITTDSTWLYPVAFVCLVASKAYGLTRAAGVPRLLPPDVRLVTANSRISLAGVAGAAVSGAIAGVLSAVAGPQWSLRWAFVVFVIGTVLAIRLPARVDSPEGESRSRWWPFGDKRHRLPSHVVTGLQVNTALRAYSGFLLTFMAFMLREHPFEGVPGWLMFTLVGGAAGAGSVFGTGLGAVLRARPPIVVVRAVLGLATGAALAAALFFNPVFAIVAALAAGLCQQLGKLSLDALIQAEVPDDMRTSVFARAETLLQSGWVLGGLLGIVLPLWPWLGFGLAATWLAATGAFLLYRYRQQVSGTRAVVSVSPR